MVSYPPVASNTPAAPQRGLLDRTFDWLTGSTPPAEVQPAKPEESYTNRAPSTSVDQLISEGKAREWDDSMIHGAPPKWADISNEFNKSFPGTDPKENEQLYNRARDLQIRRIKARPEVSTGEMGGRPADEFLLKSILPTTPVTSGIDNIKYQHVREAFDKGEDVSPEDRDFMARFDQQRAIDSKRGGGERVAGALLSVPGQLLTLKAGSALGGAIGLGAKAAGWLGLGGFVGQQAFEQSTERALQTGGEFYEPHNAVPAAAMAGVQALVMLAAGNAVKNVPNPFARAAAEVGAGFGGLQGAEVAAGTLDNFLSPAWQTNTKYGVIGKLVNGEKGEALQETVSQVLTLAAFSFLHLGKQIPKRVTGLIADGIDNVPPPDPGERPQPRKKPEPPPGEEPKWNDKSWQDYERQQEEAYQRRQQRRQQYEQSKRDNATPEERVKQRVNWAAEDILGVKPDATMEEITRAYRKRSMESHPDRGGTSDEFQWVDWAYKTLQARANPANKGPKSRPRGAYDPAAREAAQAEAEKARAQQQQQAPPEEPQTPYEPQEPTAKTAAAPETPPEAPPTRPFAETPKAPPVAEKAIPEVVPEGIKARMEDLVKRRAQARATDDFEAEMQTGRDITDLIKEYPRLRETSTFAKPRKVAPDGSEPPPQTSREKVDRLTEQLRTAAENLHASKSLESKELLSKRMGLSHRADEAGAARTEWAKRVKVLQDKVDTARDELMRETGSSKPGVKLPDLTPEQLAAKPWESSLSVAPMEGPSRPTVLQRMKARQAARREPVLTPVRTDLPASRPPKEWAGEPHDVADLVPTMDEWHEVKGLSPVERDLMKAMFVERIPVAKLAEDPKYGPRTGGGIHAMSVRLLAKMGYKGTVNQFFEKQKEELQRKVEANGGKLEHGAIGGHVAKGEKARRSLIHRVTAKEALGNRWAAHIEKLYEDGPLSADEVSSINEAISRGENPPGYDQTKRGRKLAAKRAGKASVPPGAGTSVRPDNPPEPVGEPEPGPNAPTVSAADKKLSLPELKRRSQAPPEIVAEAQRMGIDPEHLHYQALETKKLDRQVYELKLGALQLAKKTFAAMAKTEPYITNLGDFKTFMEFRKQVARGKVDASQIRGLDIVARSIGSAYPELFDQNVNERGWDEALFNMLVEGKPAKLSDADTYKVSLEYLAQLKEATTPTPEMVKEWNDELKASNQKPLTESETGEVQRSALEKSQRDNAEGHLSEVPNEDAEPEISPELFDDSFNVDEFAAFGDDTGSSEPGESDITTAGTDRPTESGGPESGIRPGGEAGVDDRPEWAKRMQDAPPGTQANLLPGSFGDLTGTQGELFDRAPMEKITRPGSMPGQTNFLDDFMGQAKKILDDLKDSEGGAVDLDRVVDAAKYVQNTLRRLQGQANPATTRLDNKVGEALMRWMVAGQWGEEAAPFFTDLVAGKNATTADRIKIGAMLTEMRLGYMRAAYRRLGNTANVKAARAAANRARVALKAGVKLAQTTRAAARGKPVGSPEQLAHKNVMAAVRAARRVVKDLEKKARTIGRYNKIANKVETIIGKPGSPFQTHQEFFSYRDSPQGKEARQRWVQHVVPVMQSLYIRAMNQQPNSTTQIPHMPVNLYGIVPGQTPPNRPGVIMTGKGGPKNLKTRKFVHAEQAKGNAPGYHTDLADIISNTFQRGADIAARNEFFRSGVQSGAQVLQWVKAGTQLEGYTEVPFTTPQGMKGSLNPFVSSSQRIDHGTLARPGTTLRVLNSAHGEVMNAFNSDTPNTAVKVLKGINQLPLMANLASAVDAASHGLNLAVAMMAPSGRPFGMVRSAGTILTRKIMQDPKIRHQLLEITRIGSNKRHGHGKGMIVDTLQKGADILGKTLPEKAQKLRYVDPTYGLGQIMQHMSDVVRLALNEAFDMHVKNGALDTETNRRDFTNQWGGAYERKAMNWLVKQFTDTGFGPFAVAGVTMNSRAVKALIGDPSIKGGTWKSTTRLRMEFIAKMAATLALGSVANWMMWGRIDGDENTPRFGIKIGEGVDGKTKSLPNPVGMMLNRGMRAIPFLSYGVDKMLGTSPPSDAESKVYDVLDAWMHPFMGPMIQAIHTAVTGKDALGKKIAAAAGEDSSVPRENVKAAIKQANPVYSALTGSYKPGEEIPLNERMAKIMGPFGFKYTEKQPAEIANLYDLGHRLRELQDAARSDAKKHGEMAAKNVRLNVIQRAETAIGKLERQRHAPGLSQAERQSIRSDEVELATSALAAAKELKGK